MSSISGKRSASEMQEEVSSLTRKLEEAKKRHATQEKMEKLVNALEVSTCMLCSEELSGCIRENMSISCYQCRCSTQRIVHTKCWTRSFLCSCREWQELPGKSKTFEAMLPVVKSLSSCMDTGDELCARLGDVKSEVQAEFEELQEKCKDLPEEFRGELQALKDKFNTLIVGAEELTLRMTTDATNSKDTLHELGYRSEIEEEEEEEEEDSQSETSLSELRRDLATVEASTQPAQV